MTLSIRITRRVSATTDAECQDPNKDQARLMETPGTMWHLVKNAEGEGSPEDVRMLEEWFPDLDTTPFSKKWRKLESTLRVSTSDILVRSHSSCLSELGVEKLKAFGVFYKGPAGDNILHMCYLLQKYELAHYLVRVFGAQLVNFPYQKRELPNDKPGPYEGEVALHIAIVNKRVDEVQFLLDNGADVNVHAWGPFFALGSSCYYGELPLSFAACMSQPDIVDALVRHGADVNAQDSYGNTALHLAVLKGLGEMYRHLAVTHSAQQCIVNNDGLSPLVLAAKLDSIPMFTAIMKIQRRQAWTYGPVTCYQSPLEEIDSVQDIDTDDNLKSFSAVKVIVDSGHAELLTVPFIDTLMQTKWKLFGQWIFYTEFALFLLLMLCLSVLVMLQRPEEGGAVTLIGHAKRGEWYVTGENKVYLSSDFGRGDIAVLECICLILTLFFAALETYDTVRWYQNFWLDFKFLRKARSRVYMTEAEFARVSEIDIDASWHSWSHHPHASDKADERSNLRPELQKLTKPGTVLKRQTVIQYDSGVREFVRMLTTEIMKQTHPISFCLYLFVPAMLIHFYIWIQHLRDEDYTLYPGYAPNLELAFAAVVGWIYVLYFSSGFKASGPLVVMMIRMVFEDVLTFMTVYLVVLLAFAQAAFLLINHEVEHPYIDDMSCNFCSVPDSMLTLFRMSIGNITYEIFQQPNGGHLTNSIFVAWALVSNILMMNLLIALMNSTYTSVMEDSEQIWKRSWARLVLVMEDRLTRRQQMRYRMGDAVVDPVTGKEQHMETFVETERSAEETVVDTDAIRLARIEGMLAAQLGVEKPTPPLEQSVQAKLNLNVAHLVQKTAKVWRGRGKGNGQVHVQVAMPSTRRRRRDKHV